MVEADKEGVEGQGEGSSGEGQDAIQRKGPDIWQRIDGARGLEKGEPWMLLAI